MGVGATSGRKSGQVPTPRAHANSILLSAHRVSVRREAAGGPPVAWLFPLRAARPAALRSGDGTNCSPREHRVAWRGGAWGRDATSGSPIEQRVTAWNVRAAERAAAGAGAARRRRRRPDAEAL